MLKRLILGLLKGLALGGALGAAVFFGITQSQGTDAHSTALTYVLYALVGGLAGVVSGKGFWVKGAWVESLLKGLFGLAVGAGLFALGHRFLDAFEVTLGTATAIKVWQHPLLMAPGIAALFASLVELDNTGEAEPEPKSGVRIRSIDDIKVDDEEDEVVASKGAAKGRR